VLQRVEAVNPEEIKGLVFEQEEAENGVEL
jgi:hypothetical protein